jgi:hypothetical protein
MTGIEPSTDRIRIYAKDSSIADGEAVVMRGAFGKPLRIIDEAGNVVGHASFVAVAPKTRKPETMPADFDPETESRRMKQGGCCGKPSE